MRERQLNVKKTLITSITINTVQIITIVIIAIYTILVDNDFVTEIPYVSGATLLYGVLILISLSSYISIKILKLSINIEEGFTHGLIETIESLSLLNKELRGQRHDYVNHLQVIYNLLELEEYAESKDYIEKVYDDVIKVNKALKTSCAAVNAILQAKNLYAIENGINVTLRVNTSLKNIDMPQWELCRILGNLIDNAIYELKNNDISRNLIIELSEDIRSYKFSVKNNGEPIKTEYINKIFEEGFTTKGNKGSGMGLAIVKDIIEEYKGTIEVESDEGWTEFKGSIPKSISIKSTK